MINQERSITLRSGSSVTVINTHGAWVELWEIDETAVLFPKNTYTLPDGSHKVRGGCHTCLPNFGPGGTSGLGQHGFARDSEWQVVQDNKDSLTLKLVVETGVYQGLCAELDYKLSINGLDISLQCVNKSDDDLYIAPGFHPYFASGDSSILVDDSIYDTNNITEAKIFSSNQNLAISMGSRKLHVATKNLGKGIVWSDKLGDYVCVEPTQSAFSFDEDRTNDMIKLQPSDDWSATMRIMVEQ